ncbi:hypothetical protein [Sphingobium chungbukense]|uniref:Uncharacterized protein n=1 Tax=Sphingobium chungbukense TaxID=56193 RepID=A0A0M3AMJ3_9SPHN|nr:hypothetical protein [Sphingobium chungbukense]KKW90161.1 hypothetical protein YP76_22280 [Sphingobium chungbukense]
MRKAPSHPIHLCRDFGRDAEMERIIEARVAIRAEAEAIRWRLRLIVIETAILTIMVLLAGWLLDQPLASVLRSGLLVCAGASTSGILLVGLSGGVSMGLSRLAHWKAAREAIDHWTKRK